MENKEKQVRKIAQRVMTKYKLHPPVDMMGLIQEKGITCVEENLGTNADGYSDLKDSDLKIVLNSAIQYEPRKRFTLAHELGHIFISWHSDVTLCVTDNEYSEHNKLDIQEHEANVFASEILMPTEWVKEMLTLNENRSLEYNIKQLCTIANTSIMACFYALENAMKSGNVIVVSGDMFFPKPCLSDYNSAQIVEDFKKIEGQIKELLKQGRNVFVLMGNNDNCYIYTGEKQYSGTGRNARQTNIVREFNAYSFLPIKLNVTEVVGERIDICCSSPYRDFFTNTRTCYYYASYFSVAENSTILGKIKGTDKVVAAVIPYGSGKIVLLPQIYEEEEYKTEDVWKENGKKYLDSLFELNRRLKITDEEMDLPGWTQNIYILDEKVKLKKQNTIENKIAKLEKELDKERIAVQEVQKYKLLLTSSGTTLEEIVKQVLDELGFTILEAEKGRSDIIAKYGEVAIVAEIKGVTKSAAEKHAAQLEKWVAQYIEENEVSPKGMLIVNGFCDMPLNERLEDVFPQQMLKYCVSRGHVLLTSTQLLCLYIEVCKNPICKEERITELLSCVGKYERYREIKDYLK